MFKVIHVILNVRCDMKKKVWIIVAIITAIVVGIFVVWLGFGVSKDAKQEELLINEVDKINELAQDEELNLRAINDILDSRVAEKEYLKVENAIKGYLKEGYQVISNIYNISTDSRVANLLTAQNYQEDGPDFVSTKAFLADTIEQLKQEQENFAQFFNEDRAMAYINEQDVDQYYIDFYRNQLLGDVDELNDDNGLNEAMNQLLNVLEISQEILDFLSSNKGTWTIENEQIVFNSQSLTNSYNDYLTRLTEAAE